MDIEKASNRKQHIWNKFAEADPMWAILSDPLKVHGKWLPNDFFETGKVEINVLIELLAEKTINFNHGTALDFGCGIGRLTQPLTEYFESVIGVDISDKMIENAKKMNVKSNCKYIVTKNIALNVFSDCSFDFIYSNISLQHNEPKIVFKYLAAFYRILKGNGILVFQMPDRFINPFFDVLWNNRISQRYLYHILFTLKYKYKNVIETYGIKKPKMAIYLNSLGFSVIESIPNRSAGPKWTSYTYYCRKR